MRRLRLCLISTIATTTAACGVGAQQDARSSTSPLPACEWCGAPEAPAGITSDMRIARADEPGTRLVVSGVVYRPDGRTPAPGVLIYAYHTDRTGVYPRRGDETGNGRRHGYLRGWLRTDTLGRYRIETIRPEPYSSRSEPAHIHVTVTQPGGSERYIPSILFADDPLLSVRERASLRAGTAPHIVQAVRDRAGVLHATRDIILPRDSVTDSLQVDPGRSAIRWKGTKFRGRGKHEGTVGLSAGALALCGQRVCGGRFTVDMRSIAITDIPAHEPVPRARLARHLASEDFFWVERHPTTTFHLREVQQVGAADYRAAGDLTLRGVTRPLAFPVTLEAGRGDELRLRARFSIDRQQWGVAYRFDPLRNELVDDEIHLDLTVVLPRGRAVAASS